MSAARSAADTVSVTAGALREGPHEIGRLSSRTLIGRDREQRLLLAAVTHPPALVLVEGEAGVGKSRLVRETLASSEVESCRVLVGHCHRLREPFLLGPIAEALRGVGEERPIGPLSPVAGALQPLMPELAHVLPAQPPQTGDRSAERHRVFRAARELLEALGPTVCVLEDLHWADEGTLEFLAYLSSQPPDGLALVLTYRGEDLPPASRLVGLAARVPAEAFKATIGLSPLGVEDVRSLICAILDTDEVSAEMARHLHERTGGIPFALEEVVRMLRDRGQLDDERRVGYGQQVDVPPAIRHSMSERMESFTADARLITRAAAVLAVPARERLLARVAGLPPARGMRGVTRALSSALLQENADGSYGFRHALAAQAVYDETPAPERRRLHQRAGEALELAPLPRPYTQLAHHFKHADLPRRWARYAEAAAQAASSVGDARAAARLLEQALSAPGLSRAATVRMAIKLALAAPYSDCPDSAIDLLQRILEEEQMAVGVRGELRFSVSYLRYCIGDGGRWYEEMVRAVGELRRRPVLAARAMVQLAWPVLSEGDVEDDLAWLPRAVAVAERIDDPVTKTGIYAQRAAILLCVGDPAGWGALEDIPSTGTSVGEKLQLLRGYQSVSGVLRALGHYRSAEAFLAEVIRIDEELDHVWWGPWRESARVSIDWCIGRWEGLEARARKLAESGSGTATLAVASELILGSLLLSQGRLEEAEGTFASILEESWRRGWLGARTAASAGLAEIHLAHGDARAARHVAAIGLHVVRRKRIWIWGKQVIPVALQAALECEERAEARDLVDQFTAGVRGRDAPAAHAAACFCQGLLAEAEGSHGVAARCFETAERGWSDLPSPYEAARARERRARCLLAHDYDEGADLLLGALQTFDDLQASRDAARVRAELKAQGVAFRPLARGGRRAYGDELSPREAEVAQLVGMGRKNREIAEALVLSPRTVEAHVAAVLRKLGFASRRALASGAGELAEAGAAHASTDRFTPRRRGDRKVGIS